MVDLWNHMETDTLHRKGKILVPVDMDPFNRSWLGTRREGNAGCIALFPVLLNAGFNGDSIVFHAPEGDSIRLTGGNPSYNSKTYVFSAYGSRISFHSYFDITTEKVVIQLFAGKELLDEKILQRKNDLPVLLSQVVRTHLRYYRDGQEKKIPEGLLKITIST